MNNINPKANNSYINLLKNKNVLSWSLYDIADTVYFVGIIGIFFPLWITEDMGGNDGTVAFTLSISIGISLLMSPIIGAMSDNSVKRKYYLCLMTLICVIALFTLGNFSLTVSLTTVSISVITMYLAGIVYNALLLEVSTKENVGFIAGIGSSIGYIGAIGIVLFSIFFVDKLGYVFGFKSTATFMLISTIPIFLFLNEKPKDIYSPGIFNITVSAFKQIFKTIKSVSKHKPAVVVLITKFFYSCSLNGALMFIVLYGTETAGFEAKYVETVYALALLVAIPFAIIWGKLIDSIGVVITTKINLIIIVILLAIGALLPELALTNKDIYWAIIGLGAGIVTPGLWVSDRPLLVIVSPPNKIGQFFGFHGLLGRLSAILASFSWGFIVTTLSFGQQTAVIFLSLCSVFALISIMFLKIK
ncbi:MAG: MFS transporter [SAR202 cluster bacterium]|nr:hypothetical protein [Chloroflexota bacterium]MQG38862.1 MFS transporter [SAR202 cluster bacterium]|tara:strand:- start:1080 stop:2330 length:1251 start_codon:yes stop_codon:yes gene_type:complete